MGDEEGQKCFVSNIPPPPFKNVGGDLIEHYMHHHHYLRLQKYNGARDSENECQACFRPINSSHDFYNCVECDFFLHEVCANLPHELNHPLHKHTLLLRPQYLRENYNRLSCSVCSRLSSGFTYRCKFKACRFSLDINCILVPECFTHKSHEEHLLFLSTSEFLCKGCKKSVCGYHLHCTQCEYAICYKCATIPDEIYYKYDEHRLYLCYGKSGVESIYWCEVCEKRVDSMEWFYTNSEYCTTIHHQCLFRDSAYMKTGHIFGYWATEVKVVGNGSSSRPICLTCQQHCSGPVYFKVYSRKKTSVIRAYTVICSIPCLLDSCYSPSPLPPPPFINP